MKKFFVILIKQKNWGKRSSGGKGEKMQNGILKEIGQDISDEKIRKKKLNQVSKI